LVNSILLWQNSQFGTLTEKSMTTQDFTLSASHLGCSRDEQLLFKPVSFALQAGEGLIVEGPNGVGKTTLLRVLAGLLPPACGHIAVPKSLAYLGPHNGVKGLLTPVEYLKFYAPTLPSSPRVDDGLLKNDGNIIDQLGLTGLEHKPCAQLSSGQKQRVALARIVLSNTTVWILDEPMTALDKQGEQIFANILNAHLSQGGIAVIATHQAINYPLKKIILEPK
jgi:heme exporter protein A